MTYHVLLTAGKNPGEAFIAFTRASASDKAVRTGDIVSLELYNKNNINALVIDVVAGWDPVVCLWTKEDIAGATLDSLWGENDWSITQISRSSEGVDFYHSPAGLFDKPFYSLPSWPDNLDEKLESSYNPSLIIGPSPSPVPLRSNPSQSHPLTDIIREELNRRREIPELKKEKEPSTSPTIAKVINLDSRRKTKGE
jgi:hypothetical protein